VGLFLPSLFLSSAYYFNSYNAFGLGAPPYGTQWVRYGPDLLLVEIGTGRIRAVYNNVFLM
jgi:Ni/Co efflux regulator RcnB